MTHAARSQVFRQDKQRFFATVHTSTLASEMARKKNYAFIGGNQYLIEQEFRQLFSALKNNPSKRDQYWLYCYYCSLLLKSYYEAYGKFDQAAEYQGHAQYALDAFNKTPKQDDPSYGANLENKLAKDLKELLSTPAHVSKLKDWIGFANITRIQLVFSKIVVKQALVIAQDLRWLEKLDALFGWHTDVNAMTARINSTANTFNVLSVGFFVARFILNAGMVLKHTFVPSDAESKMPMFERFCNEIKKRHIVFLNDITWTMVNGLSNYAPYFGIAAPVANMLTAGFLFFDAALLVYSRSLAQKDYLTKRDQYLAEKKRISVQLRDRVGHDIDKLNEDMKVIDEQIAALDLSWKTTSATYWFNVTAALLLMGGFSAALMLSAAPAALASFIVCSIGVAMYLSAGLYGKYYEKNLMMQELEPRREKHQALAAEAQSAWSDLMYAMAKNTILPMIVVTTFAISLPATLAFVGLYFSYEVGKGWLNASKPSAPALPPPDEEEIFKEGLVLN